MKNDLNFLPSADGKLCEAFRCGEGEDDHFFPRMKTVTPWQANLKKEAAAVEDYWSLFLETGAPEVYMLYRAQEDEKCRENKGKPSPTD